MTFTDRIKSAYSVLRGSAKAIPFATGNGAAGMVYQPSIQGFFNGASLSNTNVDYAREIGDLGSSSLIMAAANWLGTTLPEAPVQVVKQKSPKVFEPLPDHPMVDLLENPNPFDSGELLWQAWAYSWILDGNSYIRKVRNGFGRVVELWYEPHFTIREAWPQDGSEFLSHYEVLRNGQWYRVETEDVIHWKKGIDPNNPHRGISPVASVLREVFTDSERARFSALILKNGGVIPFVLTPDPSAATATINTQEIKDEIEYRTTGDNLGRPIVLSGPIKVQTIGVTPDKLLVEKASKIPEERVAAVIGIPAIVLGFGAGLERSTFANFKEAREAAYESFVIPTQRIIQGGLRTQLLPEFGESKGLKVAHDLSMVRVLQEDRDKLFVRETLAYEKGVKTRAEARSALGLDTKPEDEVYYVQAASEKPQPEPLQLTDGEQPKQLVNGRAKDEVIN